MSKRKPARTIKARSASQIRSKAAGSGQPTAGIVVCSPYGMACTECSELVIAPKSSAHVSNHEIRHFWSCDNCGHEIELAVNLRIDAASGPNKRLQSSVVV